MSHTHTTPNKWTGDTVIDTDKPFVIDALTRNITTKAPKRVLIQNDHNSERFSFEVPRFVEGWDLGNCNVVQIYYINASSVSSGNASGIYTVDDLVVYPFINDKLTFTWLVSQNATAVEGKLSFMVRFAKVNDDNSVDYAWSTNIYSGIDVVKTIGAEIEYEGVYMDVLNQWKTEVLSELQEYSSDIIYNHVDVAQITTNATNIDALEGAAQELADAQNVLEARMDTFTALGEGSTSGDAELADIRAGADGVDYTNAGNAVRGQYKNAIKTNRNAVVAVNKQPYATYTTSKVTVTLPATTHVYYNSQMYQFADVTAEFNHNSGTLFFILYNTGNGSVTIQGHGTTIPENCVVIGSLFQDVVRMNTIGNNVDSFVTDSYMSITPKIWCDNSTATCTYTTVSDSEYKVTVKLPAFYIVSRGCAYISARTIETIIYKAVSYRIVYNITTGDMTLVGFNSKAPSGYINVGYAHTVNGVFLNDCAHLLKEKALTLAPLIMGAGNRFVEFDSVNKTVTFPDDTLVQTNKSNGLDNLYQLHTNNDNATVSWANQTSSALIVLLNTSTNKLEIKQYNSKISTEFVAIATFRTYNGAVSINAPYKWNGRPFNLTNEELSISIPDKVDWIQDFNVKSINHRGYCTAAPENTLSAYRLSAQNGFRYAECDVAFTSDNVPVLLHDSTIDRTSNGAGNITQMTLEQARQYDYGSWFSSAYAGEQIPTFEEFIQLCKRLAIHPYIEVKEMASTTQEQMHLLVDIVKRNGMRGKVSYISFGKTPLGYIKTYDPKARIGYVVSDIDSGIITNAQELKTDTNEVFVSCAATLVTYEKAMLCVDADLPLEVWTVNNTEYITSMNRYISGVSSDNLHAGRILYNASK